MSCRYVHARGAKVYHYCDEPTNMGSDFCRNCSSKQLVKEMLKAKADQQELSEDPLVNFVLNLLQQGYPSAPVTKEHFMVAHRMNSASGMKKCLEFMAMEEMDAEIFECCNQQHILTAMLLRYYREHQADISTLNPEFEAKLEESRRRHEEFRVLHQKMLACMDITY